jgi:hypothetical protein
MADGGRPGTEPLRVVAGALGAAVLGLAIGSLLAITTVDVLWVVGQSDCPLGLEFERESSEVVAHRAFPPRVVCRYEYVEVDGEPVVPPHTVVSDATPAILMALGAVGTAVGAGVLVARRPAARPPLPPLPSASPAR